MSNEQLRIGDVVYLNSGNIPMTVNELMEDDMVEVINQEGTTRVFKAAVLRKKQPPQPIRFTRVTFTKGF